MDMPADRPLFVHQLLATEANSSEFRGSLYDRLVFVRRGHGRATLGPKEFAIQEGGILLVPRGTRLLVSAASPLILVTVEFLRDSAFVSGQVAAFLDSVLTAWPSDVPVLAAEATVSVNVMSALRTMVREQGRTSPEMPIALFGHFLCVVAMLAAQLRIGRRALAPDPRALRFQRSLRHIEDNIGRRIAVGELARIAGVSYRHYSTLFRQRVGTSVAAYIRGLRVQLAKERLLETGDVLQASLDAGFADLSNFYRVFRIEAGVTPRQFIGRNGGNSPIITL